MYPAFPRDYDRSQNTSLIQNDIVAQASVAEGYFPSVLSDAESKSTADSFPQYDGLSPETRNGNKKNAINEVFTSDLSQTETGYYHHPRFQCLVIRTENYTMYAHINSTNIGNRI